MAAPADRRGRRRDGGCAGDPWRDVRPARAAWCWLRPGSGASSATSPWLG